MLALYHHTHSNCVSEYTLLFFSLVYIPDHEECKQLNLEVFAFKTSSGYLQ